MTVRGIIEQELRNKNAIYLLKEGMFFRAYNRSAMFMVTTMFPYKVCKKWVKKVNEHIYYCGFPEQGLMKVKKKALEKGYNIRDEGEKMFVITGIKVKESYENWQKKVERSGISAQGGKGWGLSSPSAPQNDGVASVKELEIIQKLRTYQVANNTLIETMQFVTRLQKDLAGMGNAGVTETTGFG